MRRFVALGIGLVLMSGCTHQPQVSQSAQCRPVSCYDTCVRQLKLCGQDCQNNCPACKREHQSITDANYQHYVLTQRAQGFVVARERNSYLDPLACKKVTCNCTADYAVCKQQCSGKVKPSLHHPACVSDRSIWAWW